MRNVFVFLLFVAAAAAAASTTTTFYSDSEPAYHAKFHQGEKGHCTIIEMDWVRKYRGIEDDNGLKIIKKNAFIPAADHHNQKLTHSSLDQSQTVSIYGRSEKLVREHVDLYCKTRADVETLSLEKLPKAVTPEVRKIVESGDQANRIDVVFMGDGYQESERQEFFDDINRLTSDMFSGVTFKSYLPLFNIWAIYVESVESGIGYSGRPKDTAFKLYRDAGQLRGIFTGNANYARTICKLTGTKGCEYPSIIANDDFYGGLGGEFVISTRSNRTGTVVLRHEMGHNFIDVGEEYDGGQVYSGVNAASTVAGLGWSHWLDGAKREERAIYRLSEYAWHDLAKGQRSFTFTSDGKFSRWYLLVSVSAAGEEGSLEFELDGEILPWTTTGFDDREFYSWRGESGFSSGKHTFIVRSKTASTHPDIPRMICSVNLHEYGNEDEFHMDNNYVSAYPTWSYTFRKTFRPTNEGCLMRNMTSNTLCSVCREGMWYQFFNQITLIDNVTVATPENPDDLRTVTLNTLRLAQLREPGNEVDNEELRVNWFFGNVEQVNLVNQLQIMATKGSWRVEAQFVTPEVRKDTNKLLYDSATFTVT